MLSDFASKVRARLFLPPILSAATQTRVLEIQEQARAGNTGVRLFATSTIELGELNVPKRDRVSVEFAQKIIAGQCSISTDSGQILSCAYCTQLSQSGFPTNILKGYNTLNGTLTLIAYPQSEHLKSFDNASSKLSRIGGPGYFFRGSIGQMSVDRLDAKWTVRYLQSSVHIKSAVEQGLLPESCRRGYSGWSTGLIRALFQLAKEDRCQSIRIPKNRLIESFGQNRLDKMADEFGYTPASCWPKEDKFLYAKIN